MIRRASCFLVGALLLAIPAHAAPEGKAESSIEATVDAAKRSMVADPEQALVHVSRLELAARKLSDRRKRGVALATARWLAGEAQLRSDRVARAGPLLADGLRLLGSLSDSFKLRGDLLMSQGAYFSITGQAAQALANYHAAYRIFTDAHERRSSAIALQNIAMLYAAANDVGRSERYYVQAAKAYQGDPLLSLSLRNNLGSLFLRTDRYADAETQFLRALNLARSLGDRSLEARVLSNLARTQIELGKLGSAKRTLEQGFSLLATDGPSVTRQQLLASSAGLAVERGDLPNAVRLINDAFRGMDLSSTSADFTAAHGYAYRIFGQVGEPKLALAHLVALKRLGDEAAKVATTTSAALMAAKFDYQGQQLTIERLTSEQLRKAAEFQRTLFLSLGGATLAVIAMLSWGLITIRRSRNRVWTANVVLHQTNAALEKALSAKTEFLATTSHEIRTPLNGILGMTQVMLTDDKLVADLRERLGVVHSAGLTMRGLVDDILDVAKMETGNLTIDPAPMHLPETLQEVARLWEEQAQAKGLSFRLEISHVPAWIVCDAGRLRQIVFNLLSNAVKFTAKGGITLRAVVEGAERQERLKLIVTDTGIGIPRDKFGEIFESFRQVDASTTRRFGGTGLGLTICRNLAEALGGEIRVESGDGQGTEFTVELPLLAASAPERLREAPEAARCVLVLDRNPIARSMLRTLIEPHGLTLRFAAAVQDAIDILQDGATLVDSVLLDEMTLKALSADPFEPLRSIIQAAEHGEIFVLWTRPDPQTCEALCSAGVDQIIEKPVAADRLIAALLSSNEAKSGAEGSSALVSRAA